VKKRKVFILSDGGHDYSAAEKFGQIIFCTEGPIHKDDVSQMYRTLNQALLDADAKDYILVSSLTSLCMVAAAIMADAFGEVHLLIHHNGRYEERDLMLSAQR
jgi:hypothetical protein